MIKYTKTMIKRCCHRSIFNINSHISSHTHHSSIPYSEKCLSPDAATTSSFRCSSECLHFYKWVEWEERYMGLWTALMWTKIICEMFSKHQWPWIAIINRETHTEGWVDRGNYMVCCKQQVNLKRVKMRKGLDNVGKQVSNEMSSFKSVFQVRPLHWKNSRDEKKMNVSMFE
jgi:hypothetical protein